MYNLSTKNLQVSLLWNHFYSGGLMFVVGNFVKYLKIILIKKGYNCLFFLYFKGSKFVSKGNPQKP